MSWLFVEPTDIFLFRNGKPFNAGENDTAQSIFPPTPLTLQGALRGAAIVNSGMSWDEYANASPDSLVVQQVGTRGVNNVGSFRLAGPFVGKLLSVEDEEKKPTDVQSKKVERYVPLPLDIVWNEKDVNKGCQDHNEVNLRIMQPVAEQVFLSDIQFKPLDAQSGEEYPTSRWISEAALSRYLDGEQLTTNDTVKADALFKSDYRFGIGMDYTLGTTDRDAGKLYNAQFIRMESETGLLMNVDSSFVVKNDGVGLPEKGVMGLGGERHTANFEVVEVSEDVQKNYPIEGMSLPKRFKIVFLTPAYFKKGWQPENWSTFFDGQVTCINARIGHPQLIGGWDSAKRHPRTMHRFVPSGSVYYFESQEAITLKQQMITESPEWIGDAGQIGFGQVAIGNWSYSYEE